jgi:hypothetical protein
MLWNFIATSEKRGVGGTLKTPISLWHWALTLVIRGYQVKFNVIIVGCQTKRVQVWCETPVA